MATKKVTTKDVKKVVKKTAPKNPSTVTKKATTTKAKTESHQKTISNRPQKSRFQEGG
jgi:hypothetical protein